MLQCLLHHLERRDVSVCVRVVVKYLPERQSVFLLEFYNYFVCFGGKLTLLIESSEQAVDKVIIVTDDVLALKLIGFAFVFSFCRIKIIGRFYACTHNLRIVFIAQIRAQKINIGNSVFMFSV